MIYRIAIYRYENGQRKFDHYATDEEMKYLRVNSEGKVEIIESAGYRSELSSPNLPCFKTGEWVAEDEYYHGSIYSQWLDVSSTHEVEWGCIHEGKALYENDIVTAEYYLFQDEGKYNYHGLLYYDTESYCMGLGYVCVANNKRGISDGLGNSLYEFENLILLGNIHENPELLEVEE